MIKTVAHISDYHIHNLKWHERYSIGNEFIYEKLRAVAPDRIVIVGDLFEDFVNLTNESKICASTFLNNLADIAQVIIVEGNHDIMKKNANRISSVKTIVDIMNNQRITHYNKSNFFEDDNVVWVNHSHLEKKINPWNDIPHKKDKTKTYIDLFHDPINGCINDTGQEMKSKTYRNLSDFKGDVLMAGDIHKLQFLDKTKAYASSTYQQTFGESVENHGFLVWDINTKTPTFVEVPDEYKLITFKTDVDFNYDNIIFDHPLATKKSSFRIIWKDYSANINNDNEQKLRVYISNKWNDDVRIEKNRVYTTILNSQKLTESININDKQTQQDIFKEYLTANKYDDAFIEEILTIDNVIESRMEIIKTIDNIEWGIDKIWGDNFKSYDKLELDWSNIKSSIIQIGGENMQGKSTILDLITYISHGTTLATNKLGGAVREKNGDNRYINNKRDLDYCEGGMVINVNGELYTLVRRSERTWNKTKTAISSVSTNIEYYDGVEMTEDNKLRGDRKTDTQNMLDSIIGDFEDFVRLTLTNSENLNYLISLDRATFIDSIIRDAGLGIFEKKLEIFKDYKKEFTETKINLNLKESEAEIEKSKEELLTFKTTHEEIESKLSVVDNNLSIINRDRDDEIKKLNKIDAEISNIDVDSVTTKIEEYKIAIESNLKQQNVNSYKMKELKSTFDKEQYETLLKLIKKTDDDILNLKLKISQEESKIEKEKNTIEKVNDKIDSLKEKEITFQKSKLTNINNDIEKISDELVDAINEKKRNLLDKKKTSDFEIKTLSTEINNIKDFCTNLRSQIKELVESKICPECKRKLEPVHQAHIDEKVSKLNIELEEKLTNGKSILANVTEYKKTSEKLQQELENLENDIYSDDIINIQNNIKIKLEDKKKEIQSIDDICKEIENNIFVNAPELEKNINNGINIKNNSLSSISNIEQLILDLKKDIKDKSLEISDTQDKVSIIEKDRDEVDLYNTLNQNNVELILKMDNIKLTIENAKNKIDKYYNQLKFIKDNELIESAISRFDFKLDELNLEKTECNDKIANVMKDASLIKANIESIQKNIQAYKEQIKRDELLKEYNKCLMRDGIPTFLLQKYRNLINIEIEDLLTNVDFNVFFDESLVLKMYKKDFPNAIQNCLEGSGMERTFAALVLKTALRSINMRSKPRLLLLDECMGKLKGESVEKFNFLLNTLKSKIDKIIIIEHTHHIDWDLFISVDKDKNGVSSLTIES